MKFSVISVLIFFLYYFYKAGKPYKIESELKRKYNYYPWHYGFFAYRNLKKMITEEERKLLKEDDRRVGRVLLYFFLYTIFISMISGIFFDGKL